MLCREPRLWATIIPLCILAFEYAYWRSYDRCGKLNDASPATAAAEFSFGVDAETPSQQQQRRILVNYAHQNFIIAQRNNCQSALANGFDECRMYNRSMLDPDFVQRHAAVFALWKGVGLWIWKSYIVVDAMRRAAENDLVFYSDSDALFHDRNASERLFVEMNRSEIVVFDGGAKVESSRTKRDLFVLLDVDRPEFASTPQRYGGFVGVKNTPKARRFITEWAAYAADPRCLTEMDNVLGLPNYPDFQVHRHDQSILSLLSKKWNVTAMSDPTKTKQPKNATIGHLLKLTRFWH